MCPTDKFYVVPLTQFHRVTNDRKDIQKCFTFCHPHKEGTFSRMAKLSFNIAVNSDVTGFGGYFEAFLYKDYYFTTIPGSRQNNASLSWFPIYIPVRNPIRCPPNSILHLDISRCTDESGVWYEWQENVSVVSFALLIRYFCYFRMIPLFLRLMFKIRTVFLTLCA
jgi:hypothetical protein